MYSVRMSTAMVGRGASHSQLSFTYEHAHEALIISRTPTPSGYPLEFPFSLPQFVPLARARASVSSVTSAAPGGKLGQPSHNARADRAHGARMQAGIHHRVEAPWHKSGETEGGLREGDAGRGADGRGAPTTCA